MPTNQVSRWISVTVPTALFVFALVALGLATNLGPMVATADVPQPVPVPFTGTPFTTQLDLPENDRPMARGVLGIQGEITTYTETFENGLPVPPPTGPRWVTFDTSYGTTPQNYVWAGTTFTNGVSITGTQSLWAIGGGAIGSTLDPISDTYPANIDSWLVYGPFDLSEAQDVGLTFDLLVAGQSGTATFSVAYSTNGTSFTGQKQSFPLADWFNYSYLGLSQALGQEQVWLGFNFATTGAGNGPGAFLDNFVLTTEAPDPTPTPTATPPIRDVYLPSIFKPVPVTPTPTPTPAPIGENYYTNFSNVDNKDIAWLDIRRRNVDGNIDNETLFTNGMLQAQARSRGDYFILSPLSPAINAPYEIRVDAQIMNKSERSGFNVIFGGDFNSIPGTCPSGDLRGCFNEYYQLSVRYRTGDRTEVRVSHVTSHDANNQPIEQALWGWVVYEQSELDGDSLHKWKVRVGANGSIHIDVNNRELVFLDGPRTIDNRYYGLGIFSDATDPTDSRTRFHNFCAGTADFCANPTGGEALLVYDFTTAEQVGAWKDVRRTRGATTDNELRFIPLTTDPRGLMQMHLRKPEQFFVAAPMVQGPVPGTEAYSIETNWGFVGTSFEDRMRMGILFAANATDANNCNNALLNNCFDQYYAALIRYRQGVNDQPPYYEVTVQKANGGNSTDNYPIFQALNTGPGWQAVDTSFNPYGNHTWRVTHATDGTIVVYIENTEVWRGRDTTYQGTNRRYFGYLLDTFVDLNYTEAQAINVDFFRILED